MNPNIYPGPKSPSYVGKYGYVWKWGINPQTILAIKSRDCLISKTIGFFGLHNIFRQTLKYTQYINSMGQYL